MRPHGQGQTLATRLRPLPARPKSVARFANSTAKKKVVFYLAVNEGEVFGKFSRILGMTLIMDMALLNTDCSISYVPIWRLGFKK